MKKYYNKIIFENDNYEVRLIDDIVDQDIVKIYEGFPPNYAIFFKKYNTLEKLIYEYLTAINLAERMNILLETEETANIGSLLKKEQKDNVLLFNKEEED